MGEGAKTGGTRLFASSLLVIVVTATIGIAAPKGLAEGTRAFIGTWFGAVDWFFLLTASGLMFLAIGLAFSRYGKLTLGKPGEKPEFSTASWLAMLFAAGMGTGILFWGVAEPVTHFLGAPGVVGEGEAAAREAIVLTGFHWGFHAWGIYAMAALVLGYFCFRRGTPYLPGAPIREVFPPAWARPVGTIADFIAVLAIVFGVAGAMTMGIFQIQSGLGLLFGVDPKSTTVAVGILVVLVIAYMSSAATSLDKGIKWLSNINICLAISLGLFVLFAGETTHLMQIFVTSLGDYFSALPRLSLRLSPYGEDGGWISGWTITYLIWWVAWAPFVGVFIARISRGRTIREFVFGVMLVPTVFSLLWFSILGGSALYETLNGSDAVTGVVSTDVTMALFALFESFPGSSFLTGLSMVLVFVFMVTSVDSATFVLGMLTSEGAMDPPRSRKMAWGVCLGLLGGSLTLTRNIDVIRGIAILGAIPFTFLLLLQVVAFLRALRTDHGDQ